MNCEAEAGHQWSGVMVCADCKRMADKLMERNQKQLNHLLLLCKERIRATLVSGRLRVGDASINSCELRSDLQTEV